VACPVLLPYRIRSRERREITKKPYKCLPYKPENLS
jgi:hypothetical protein